MVTKRSSLSLNFEVLNIVDGWVLGTFFMLIDGVCVGDRADVSVDLRGCLRWWRDLANNPRNRYEPGLYDEDKDRAFLLLASAVLVRDDPEDTIPELYADSFSRFHISHIGMSSFDDVTMIFLKNEDGLERLIWKASGEEIYEAHLAESELERTFLKASVDLERSIAEFAAAS